MIHKAVPEDAGRLAEIHIFGWRQAYKNIISEDILLKDLSVKDRISSFQKSLFSGFEETYVFKELGIIKGFITIGNCRDDDKDKNCFELWGIYVEPTLLHSGIGTKLLHFFEETARSRKRDELIIWVLEENKNARLFYEKNGYNTDNRTKYLEKYKVTEIRYIKNIPLEV